MINGWILCSGLLAVAIAIKVIKVCQEWHDRKTQKKKKKNNRKKQNIYIFKNTNIGIALNDIQSIEQNNAKYVVVYMKDGRSWQLNYNEGIGLMKQFVKYKTKNKVSEANSSKENTGTDFYTKRFNEII
jgi:hypothetical protein